MERFLRSKLLLGEDKLEILAQSRVAVIGLGAVGSYVVEGLARGGIGNFLIVDFDKVEESNINRQLYAFESTIGVQKVDLAKQRILDINPKAKVEGHNLFFREEIARDLFPNKPDFVVDAIDALNSKVGLLAYLYQNNIQHISSMGAALRRDPFAIKLGDLFESKGCPLARFVRKRLRRRGINSGIMAIYSEERKKENLFDLQVEDASENTEGRKRQPLGSLPTITGIFGLLIAHYTIEKLITP